MKRPDEGLAAEGRDEDLKIKAKIALLNKTLPQRT